MSVNSLLGTIVLVCFLVTTLLAIASYVTYKIRERRRPAPAPLTAREPEYFERIFDEDDGASRFAPRDGHG